MRSDQMTCVPHLTSLSPPDDTAVARRGLCLSLLWLLLFHGLFYRRREDGRAERESRLLLFSPEHIFPRFLTLSLLMKRSKSPTRGESQPRRFID